MKKGERGVKKNVKERKDQLEETGERREVVRFVKGLRGVGRYERRL